LDAHRQTAVVVGMLFVIATLTPLLSAAFIGSIYEPAYLTAVSASENQVLIGVLLLLTMTAAIVSIPILLFPILKKQHESLALGYVGARIFEGFFSAVNIIAILSLLSLSRKFIGAGAIAVAHFQTSGALLLAQFNWGSLLLDVPFCISAIVLNYLLYKAKLVPRWLSGWGFIGGAVWLPTVPFRMFSLLPESLEVLALIIAAQEMVFAVWLIAKGFNLSAVNSKSTETDPNKG
jgi:hypothetical protein